MNGQSSLQENVLNQTIFGDVLLLGFHSLSRYRFVLFVSFLVIYTFILSGNLLIIFVTLSNKLLHSPMFFFLCNLSLSEIFFTTNIIPKMLQIFLKNGVTVSLYGCFTQLSFFGIFLITESFLLTVMSYDRFLAICKPLYYSSTMHFSFCCYLSLACWILPFLIMSTSLGFLLKLDFCRRINVIDHFFCDFVPILGLSCSDTSTVRLVVYLLSPASTIFPFLFIIVTYVCIIRAILTIQSVTGKKKAFSTCSSHLSVVCTYYITLFMVYLVPSSGHSLQLNKVLSLLYTVMTPLLNPFIYSLNNREIKSAMALSFKNQKSLKVLVLYNK
ncbi:hypothetical protein GDO86_017732 [Hymenochirus boettgeri]|uniref:Olfactory receptor n=1 Tax=Hymenochirus boettgeri TaxID=247094 RepID=A0A8T2IP20_9PIPI|nr:hypothetical protein GDO86_017732 [Hymenochirus boettgeri]